MPLCALEHPLALTTVSEFGLSLPSKSDSDLALDTVHLFVAFNTGHSENFK